MGVDSLCEWSAEGDVSASEGVSNKKLDGIAKLGALRFAVLGKHY
jgi:hypothetical protein